MRGDVRRICQTLADGYPVHIRVVSCLAPPWDNPQQPQTGAGRGEDPHHRITSPGRSR